MSEAAQEELGAKKGMISKLLNDLRDEANEWSNQKKDFLKHIQSPEIKALLTSKNDGRPKTWSEWAFGKTDKHGVQMLKDLEKIEKEDSTIKSMSSRHGFFGQSRSSVSTPVVNDRQITKRS